MKKFTIPRHEPETIKAGVRKNRGDDEKISTTIIKELVVDGIVLVSRYDKADEYETMQSMVKDLHVTLKQFVVRVFCDSKAQTCYLVALKPCTWEQAYEIGKHLEATCLKIDNGHNGITLEGSLGGDVDINPNWQ